MTVEIQAPPAEKEAPEVINAGLIIERRTAGDITYIIALCTHTRDFAEAIEKELRGCGYLAIEQPGHNFDKERSATDPVFRTDEKMRSTISNLVAEPKTRAFFIDMSEDDPNIGVFERSKNALKNYLFVISRLGPPSQAAMFLDDAAYFTAKSDEAREAVIDNQLAVQTPHSIRKGTVGVLLGMQHYRAIGRVGDNPPDPALLAAKITPLLNGFSGFVNAYRSGEKPNFQEVGHHLLSDYFKVSGIPNEKVRAIAGEMQPDVVNRLLNAIETQLAAIGEDTESREKELFPFLHAAFEKLEHAAKLKAASTQP